jgi:hypothetical protein
VDEAKADRPHHLQLTLPRIERGEDRNASKISLNDPREGVSSHA